MPGLFSDVMPSSSPTTPLPSTSQPVSSGGLFSDVATGTAPKAPSNIASGYAKLGSTIISGLGADVSKLNSDIYKTAFKPIKNWGDYWDVVTQGVEEATRPVRSLVEGVAQAGIGAVSMPIQSAIQAMTGKSTSYTLPVLGKFQSYQDQVKQLKPVFGGGVAATFPIVQEALNALAVAPEGTLGNVAKLFPEATPAPAVVRFLGPAAKDISPEDLGTFENVTKMQSAVEALKTENFKSIDIQGMTDGGDTPAQAQAKALQAVKVRAQSITPEEHLNTIYRIAKNLGETPEEVAKNVPNFIQKQQVFEQVANEIGKRTNLDPSQLVLLSENTPTDKDLQGIIDEVQKSKFSSNINENGKTYTNLIDKLYNDNPWLTNFHNDLDPKMEAGDPISPGVTVEGFRGKQDLLNRLNAILPRLNKEITVPIIGEDDPMQEALDAISGGEGRGYRIGFSPIEHAVITPWDTTMLPEQNFLGKTFDALGLREVDSRAINAAWKQKLTESFSKAFPNGITDKDGNVYDFGYTDPTYKKSGFIKYPGGKGNIIDKLMELATAKNGVSITDLTRKDLASVFGKDNGDVLGDVLADSRVLPRGMQGWGTDLVNAMRKNRYFDEFYKMTLAGRFGLSPGYAVRHIFKNQILGAFEDKPVNLLAFANTDMGQALIKKFPTVFGGTLPTAAELSTLKTIIGNTSIDLDPASEAWVYNQMGDAAQDLAVKNAIASPNFIERVLGYTQTQDVMDLARTYAKKAGKTLEEIAEDPAASKDLKSLIKETYGYGSGVISSPAMKTMNQIFYPIRFETKVLLNTAKWWVEAPVFTRSAVVKLFNEGMANGQTPAAKSFMKKNANVVKAISYLLPYPTMINLFGDALNAVSNLNHPSQALGSAYNDIQDNFTIGGIAFGMLQQQAQSQGIMPQTQYIDPTGKKYPIYVPKGAEARLKMFITQWMDFMWPGGLKILGTVPGSVGTTITKELPSEASYLPANQRQKVQPGKFATKF